MNNHFVFFLPSGSVLGGVELWSFNVVRALNSLSPRSASILSFSIKDKLNVFPSDLQEYVKQVPIDYSSNEKLNEAVANIVSELKDNYPENSILIPNYSDYAYAVAVGIKMASRRTCDIWAVLHSDERHYYDVATFYSCFISKFICVSSEIERSLLKFLPERKLSILTKICGVVVDDVSFQDIEEKYLKCRKPIVISYVGRVLEYQKRFSDVLIFLRLLEKKNIDFELNIIGDGDDFKYFETKISRSYNLSPRVKMHGRIPPNKVKEILLKTHIYISFSSFEGTSLALIESMNYGCIPVVTKVSGVKDLLRNSHRSFIYEIGDIGKAVAYVTELLGMKGTELLEIAKSNMVTSNKYSINEYAQWLTLQNSKSDPYVAQVIMNHWRDWNDFRKVQKIVLVLKKVLRFIRQSIVYRYLFVPLKRKTTAGVKKLRLIACR